MNQIQMNTNYSTGCKEFNSLFKLNMNAEI